MDFVDLAAQQLRIKETISLNIHRVLAHGNYVMGPEVKQLEMHLAAYTGTNHAISCASGTDALLIALMACGVKPGDAVFTTPFTFIATAEVISLLGGTPVFVDIDPTTFNIDPAKLVLAIKAVETDDPTVYPLPDAKMGPALPPVREGKGRKGPLFSRGVIPVDLFGLPADYDAISATAKEHGLFVIEDAAQSFGAKYKDRTACSLGDVGCTSFFPAKPLGCYGEGGMCFTNEDYLAEIMESIRMHGKGGHKYDNVRIGINGRLDTLQAAILLAKLDIFPEEIELRQTVARRYTDLLANADLELRTLNVEHSPLVTPYVPAGYVNAWAQYSLLAKNEDHRTVLRKRLQDNKIPSAVYYPKPLHLQHAFAHLGYKKGDFPVSENCAGRIFSLPMHPYLKAEDQENIVHSLTEWIWQM